MGGCAGRGTCYAAGFITPLVRLMLLVLLELGVNAWLAPWQNGHGPSRNDCDRLMVRPCEHTPRNDPFFGLCCTITLKHDQFVANKDDCKKDFHQSCNDTRHQNFAFCCIYEGHRCLEGHRCFDQAETLKFLNRWPGQEERAKKMYADGYYCGEHFCCVYEYSTCLKSHRGPNSTQECLDPYMSCKKSTPCLNTNPFNRPMCEAVKKGLPISSKQQAADGGAAAHMGSLNLTITVSESGGAAGFGPAGMAMSASPWFSTRAFCTFATTGLLLAAGIVNFV